MKKITVLGGGTGTYVVLSGLKKYDLDLGVIVTMMDSGGSTGRLRDQLGVLPPGDLRQTLVALSEASLLWRKLFLYRFENGDLEGHNFGNIFLSALEKVCTNYDEVIETASYVLKTKGHVLPVTYSKAHLNVEYQDGTIVKGEGNIDDNHKELQPIKRAFLEPSDISVNPKALQRIEDSDFLIIGPGDLYTSIVPVLLVPGIKEAIRKTKAKIIYISNLMTKGGQTHGYTLSAHVNDLSKYSSRTPNVILTNSELIPEAMVEWYKKWNETIVKDDLSGSSFEGAIVKGEIIDTSAYTKKTSDKLFRSILRHNPEKLAKLLLPIIA